MFNDEYLPKNINQVKRVFPLCGCVVLWTAWQIRDFVVGYSKYQTEQWHNANGVLIVLSWRSITAVLFPCRSSISWKVCGARCFADRLFAAGSGCECPLLNSLLVGFIPSVQLFLLSILYGLIATLGLCVFQPSPAHLVAACFSSQMCGNNFNSLFASWGDERLVKDHEVVI